MTVLVVAVVVTLGLATAAWLAFAPGPAGSGSSPGGETRAATTGPEAGAPAVEGSEVLPPDATATRPDRLPDLATTVPRVSVPLPASGSAEGALVDGYPADLAPPAEGSEVIDTTVTTEGDTMQFSLRARTGADAATILEHYRGLWAGLGLVPAPTAQTDALGYTDAYSSVTVTAEAGGTGLVYTIYGVLRAG